MIARPAAALVALGLLASCAGASGDSRPAATVRVSTTTSTIAVPTSTTGTTSTSSTLPAATPPPAGTATEASGELQRIVLGQSVEGRDIEAVERGVKGGRVVLVIGCIHGDEAAGVAVARALMTAPVPAGVDLWVVPTMNPDGQAHGTRTNARQVDLNRNFPYRWAPLGQPGDSEYAGAGAASEPETRLIVGLVERLAPVLTVWYHQDLNRIAPAAGRAGRIRRRYADLTGLPVLPVTGGTYTGTASPWAQTRTRGVAFIVELGPALADAQAAIHAQAVLTVAAELDSV